MMVQLRFRVPFLKGPLWLYPNSLERFCLMWNENGSIELCSKDLPVNILNYLWIFQIGKSFYFIGIFKIWGGKRAGLPQLCTPRGQSETAIRD